MFWSILYLLNDSKYKEYTFTGKIKKIFLIKEAQVLNKTKGQKPMGAVVL